MGMIPPSIIAIGYAQLLFDMIKISVYSPSSGYFIRFDLRAAWKYHIIVKVH